MKICNIDKQIECNRRRLLETMREGYAQWRGWVRFLDGDMSPIPRYGAEWYKRPNEPDYKG